MGMCNNGALQQVLGSWGERPFIFRELGSTSNYFQGTGEQALKFWGTGEHGQNVIF